MGKMKVAQSCLTLCDSMDYTVRGILQARTLEWVAYHFSRGSSHPRDWTQVSHIAGRILTSWATRKAQPIWEKNLKTCGYMYMWWPRASQVTQFSSVQWLSHVRLFVTPWTAAHRASLSITNSQSLLKLMSIKSVMPSNISSSVIPFSSCLQFFPAWESFLRSQIFASAGQSIGVSVSVLPMNIQDWFPLGWTGWISLQSKGLSRVFSNPIVQMHQLFGTQFFLWSNSHIHTWLLEKPWLWLDESLLAE